MAQFMRLHMDPSMLYTQVLANIMTGLDDKDLLVLLIKVLPKVLASWKSTVWIANRAKKKCAPRSVRLSVNLSKMKHASACRRCSVPPRTRRSAPPQSVSAYSSSVCQLVRLLAPPT